MVLSAVHFWRINGITDVFGGRPIGVNDSPPGVGTVGEFKGERLPMGVEDDVALAISAAYQKGQVARFVAPVRLVQPGSVPINTGLVQKFA